MNKENEDIYLQSLEDKSLQEATFSNLTTADFLRQTNKKKAAKLNSVASSSSCSPSTTITTEQINKKLEEINQYVCEDNVKINNSHLSVGTIIMRQAMIKHMDFTTLTASDIALVNCGLNCILDLTRGSLTNQNLLFSKQDWSQIKTLFLKSPIDNNFIGTRPAMLKIHKVFKNPLDIEECYWNSKTYQKKASKTKEKLGYELSSIIIDKMIKHATIFSISKPSPSEADVMIKIWADLFEALFSNTGIYIRWGEKGLITGDADSVMFKLDAKLVLIYDENEYPVSCMEFAPYSGPKKIKTDRSKLLVEAKALYNQTIDLNVDEENESILKIVNIQIMGLEAHVVSVKLIDHLYVANSIESYMIPSTCSQLKKEIKAIIGHLSDFKQYTLDTVNIVKQTLNDKKKTKKSMKRKMEDDDKDEEAAPPPQKTKLAPVWRYKTKSEK